MVFQLKPPLPEGKFGTFCGISYGFPYLRLQSLHAVGPDAGAELGGCGSSHGKGEMCGCQSMSKT